jgi:hypothetical protein
MIGKNFRADIETKHLAVLDDFGPRRGETCGSIQSILAEAERKNM